MAADSAPSAAILGALPQEVAALPGHCWTPPYPLEKVRLGGVKQSGEQTGMGIWRLQEGMDPMVMAHTGSYPLFSKPSCTLSVLGLVSAGKGLTTPLVEWEAYRGVQGKESPL